MDLNSVMASFLSKHFGSFLDNDTNLCNTNGINGDDSTGRFQMNKSHVPSSYRSNLSKSPFKSSLSRLPPVCENLFVIFLTDLNPSTIDVLTFIKKRGNLRNTDDDDDDDVLAI
ncbi:unnamed protein product [Schistosoma mattheei]|uniref:Uncharacterized protein n=1 Tax=Schistosoma mattheei TaxID=31246 RepID=A0A183PXI8_9TREM|nr:unnamed protein product [Schistosoma mattheei]